jgi:hypothetical protein
MGTFTPQRGTHHFISIQRGMTHPSHGHPHPTHGHTSSHLSPERNDTPISWAHPTHGLSHRLNHLVCVPEDVSRSCNHQHSLSAMEEFSTRPSLSWKYSNFVLTSGLVKISAICACVGRYFMCTSFLYTISLT